MISQKSRNLTSGVRFSESTRSIFSLRVQNNIDIEKGWNFDIFFKEGPEHPIHKNFSGTEYFSGSGKILGICACLNLEVLSVPEGLVHSIGILEAPGVFLARRWLKS